MFKLSEIEALIKLIDESSIEELEIEKEGSRIRIARSNPHAATVSHMAVQPAVAMPSVPQAVNVQQPAVNDAGSASAEQAQADTAGLHTIASPMVGTFYCAPAPNSAPFVKKGDKVKQDTVVCIVEAMKLMNEIEAEVNGEIVDVLVEDGQLVEFGQPLFLVKES